jgi:hypothetical protein
MHASMLQRYPVISVRTGIGSTQCELLHHMLMLALRFCAMVIPCSQLIAFMIVALTTAKHS